MAKKPDNRGFFTATLRTKLLLVSLTLLVIPWIGYQYVREIEAYLRSGQEESLLSTAQTIATVLHEQPDLFRHQGNLLHSVQKDHHLYVRPLQSSIQLDGYTEDWQRYQERMQTYGNEQIIEGGENYQPSSLSYQHQVGSYNHYLYAIFQVRDDKIVYRDPNTLRLDKNDHLQIAMEDADGNFVRYLLATTSPGWVNAHRMPEDQENKLPLSPEVRIKGEWQETADGYLLEIRIPLNMIGAKLGFAIADVDDTHKRVIKTIIGTAGTRRVEELGTVMVPSPQIEKLLKGLERSTSRIWVADTNQRVLALAGSLKQPLTEITNNTQKADLNPFSLMSRAVYRLILKQPASDFQDDLSGVSRLEGEEVQQALQGKPLTRWRQTPDQRVAILSASHPVWSGDRVIGAVVVEQTSNSILILQNRAMENLINLSLLAFLIVTLTLIFFATRLSSRIRRLRNETDNAIGPDGKVQGTFSSSNATDEIGDLSRSFSDMHNRLQQYTRYLETMASKLSHELRTPLSIVRSSLDNLEQLKLDTDSKKYTSRARDGVDRLNNILTRMSEATRLEQSLQQTEREEFDLRALVIGCVEGYRSAFPNEIFELETMQKQVILYGAPDLIAQMLDKLVSNAVDFHSLDTPIRINLTSNSESVIIQVKNEGPPLPSDMQENLFDSMVSIRGENKYEAHLGLGLYIARMITEFHHGRIFGANCKEFEGADFTVTLPFGFSKNT